MRRGWIRAGGAALALALIASGPALLAVITAPMPLQKVLDGQQFICVARVEKLDPARPAAVLQVEEDLKGKLPYRRLPVNLTGDGYAKKHKHTPLLLKRLAPNLPLVLFIDPPAGNSAQYTAFGYTNGTWFQLTAQPAEQGGPGVWKFTHAEPYLRRTFKGTTAELRQVIKDGLSGKKKPPAYDGRVAPGFGPEVKAQGRVLTSGPPFAVIPTLGVGGPLAILAVLFPSLFGGVLLLFSRWAAFFMVISVNSLLYCLHAWFAGAYLGAWWTPPAVLWFVMTLVTLFGAVWAWQRHVRTLSGDQATPEPPQRTEHLVLWMLSLSCLAGVLFCLFVTQPRPFEPWWNLLLALSCGVWAGTLYKLYHRLFAAPRSAAAAVPRTVGTPSPVLSLAGASSEGVTARPQSSLAAADAPLPVRPAVRRPSRGSLPTEGVMLWVVLLASITFAAFRPGGGVAAGEDVVAAEGEHPAAKLVADQGWTKVFDGDGMVLSAPLVDRDRIYVSASRSRGLRRFGTVYCVDARTQEVIWTFDDKGALKQVYCSPCLADGRIYVGEGFHEDNDCKLYCLDARTGKKLWEFATASHTESTPVVANGRVYFGAGDDGVYCLDALKGTKLWQFPGPERAKTLRLHCDARPAVVGQRVYVGGGIDEDTGECDPALVCLDAASGKEIWARPTPKWMVQRDAADGTRLPLPAWGAPVVDGGRVYYGLGNGRITESSQKFEPTGALLCVDAATGKDVWTFKVGDGVLNRAALDGQRVYFGSRDGYCYCLNRKTGELVWKRAMGSPVVAAPTLDLCPHCGHSTALYAVGTEGRVSCLDPRTGKVQWTHAELAKFAPMLASTPTVVVGPQRRIYFGATLNNLQNAALCCLVDEPAPK